MVTRIKSAKIAIRIHSTHPSPRSKGNFTIKPPLDVLSSIIYHVDGADKGIKQ
jgi:hypothetical protein